MRSWAALRMRRERPHVPVARFLSHRASGRVAAVFVAWMQAVEAAARRPIQIQCPGCHGVSLDEERLVVACGIAPAALEVGEQLLEPLLRDVQLTMSLAQALNAALAGEGFPMPVRLFDEPLGRADLPMTLH